MAFSMPDDDTYVAGASFNIVPNSSTRNNNINMSLFAHMNSMAGRKEDHSVSINTLFKSRDTSTSSRTTTTTTTTTSRQGEKKKSNDRNSNSGKNCNAFSRGGK